MFCLNLSETIKDTTCFLNFVDVSLSKEINPISLVNACTGCFQTSNTVFFAEMKKRLNGIKYFVEKEIFSFNFVYLRLIKNIVTTCFIYCDFTVKLFIVDE